MLLNTIKFAYNLELPNERLPIPPQGDKGHETQMFIPGGYAINPYLSNTVVNRPKGFARDRAPDPTHNFIEHTLNFPYFSTNGGNVPQTDYVGEQTQILHTPMFGAANKLWRYELGTKQLENKNGYASYSCQYTGMNLNQLNRQTTGRIHW